MIETQEGLTWERLVAEEPALAGLEAEIRQIKAPKDQRFCANAVWFGYPGQAPGFKNRLMRLVGWHARNAILRTAEAYDLGYEHLYELLPDCQHDGCFC